MKAWKTDVERVVMMMMMLVNVSDWPALPDGDWFSAVQAAPGKKLGYRIEKNKV